MSQLDALVDNTNHQHLSGSAGEKRIGKGGKGERKKGREGGREVGRERGRKEREREKKKR